MRIGYFRSGAEGDARPFYASRVLPRLRDPG